jgi:CubicO group peptidase (beta-lactamase class C family)
MKKIQFIILLLLISSTSFAQRLGDPSAFIDSVVNVFRGSTNSAVIVGVVRMPQGGPMETFKYTYGHLKRDTITSPPVNDSTLFQIGSITKTFNATLLSMLVNNGTINLYDTVQKYLPDSVHAPVYVTRNDTMVIRFIDLVTHTSGLPDEPPIGSGGMTTYEQMYNYLAGYQLTYPPGQCYYYSDMGFALLGVAMQTILQDSIELLIPDWVCDTLGIYDSKMIGLTPNQQIRRAQGYYEGGSEAPFLMPNWPAYHGAGGLYSTLNDMLKYLEFAMQIDNHGLQNVLDTLMLQRRVTNDSCQMPASIDSVGMAWQFAKLYPQNPENHMRMISKDGSTAGFCSFICFSTRPATGEKFGVVMVSNWKNPVPLQNTTTQILKFIVESTVGIQNNTQLAGYELKQNYPNPFNPPTVISYSIPRRENVSIKIYDILGNEAASLVNKKQDAGNYNIEWSGEGFASGVYYYKITAGDFVETKKMILLK